MAVANSLLSAAGCLHCRSLLLSIFATNATPRHASLLRLPYPRLRNVHVLPVRPLSFSARNPSQLASAAESSSASPEPEQSVPWYLQVEPPTHIAPIEPPPLPDVPSDSPPLIRSLLEYASEEMGLDALTLLDLRRLDPPPALGPNLFMMFGTARSERHLNVSAGRLVRWLRAKHRVSADADGLLGPNERKTKLRRKARRAKLLGTMGTDDSDDGIRTGWVCVNLGTVGGGGGTPDEAHLASDGKLSGFGVSNNGSTVVFQIMTEPRRVEMDLEKLWTRALDRSTSPSAPAQPAVLSDDPCLHTMETMISTTSHRPSTSHYPTKSSFVSRPNQSRSYTTTPRTAGSGVVKDITYSLTYDPKEKRRVLNIISSNLADMSAEQARDFLGSTSFPKSPAMELMRLAMQTLPRTATWSHRLAVQYRASQVFPHDILPDSFDDLQLLVDELRTLAVQPTRNEHIHLLSCIFRSYNQDWAARSGLALLVLQTMHQRNQSIMASDVLATIVSGERGPRSEGPHLELCDDALLDRVSELLCRSGLEPVDDSLAMCLMEVYSQRQSWDKVWNAWRLPARCLRPRSAAMYQYMFELARETQSRLTCRDVLRRCIPELLAERPIIDLDPGIYNAAIACIRIADSTAVNHAETMPQYGRGAIGQLANREFVRLARLLKRLRT